MTATERRACVTLGGLFSIRMLGLFLVFPVIALHAERYPDATPVLVGWALGVYGLTQAIFQIPFGMLSDRVGRKRVIAGGFMLFALGSALAASADTMHEIVVGRALQGTGAIAAAIMALAADLTREQHRTKVMASIGVSIGLAFAAAQVLGPLVSGLVGLSGLFWFTAALALGGIVVLFVLVPTPPQRRQPRDAAPVLGQLYRVLANPQLARLDAGIFFLHLVMTATFVALPLALRDQAGLAPASHWVLYVIVFGVSVALMAPAIIMGERSGRLRGLLIGAVVAVVVAQGALALGHASVLAIGAALVVYFTAFNIVEATLPSLVSRIAPPEAKGTGLAAFSTSQYLGTFVGGPLGGWLLAYHGIAAVFAACGALGLVWLVLALGVHNPPPVQSRVVRVGATSAEEAEATTARLLAVPGVEEAVVVPEDGVAYLKVEAHALDREALRAACALPG